MVHWRAAMLAIAALTLAFAGSGRPLADDAHDRPTPSGLPVPRYVSLKFDTVNARAGPSDDHRLLFVYRVKGLPVQVVAETEDWRRICDPDGKVSWVHRRTTDGRRMVMRVQSGSAAILAAPKPGAKTLALLAHRALASLDRCDKSWCKIRVADVTGWVTAADLWGTDDAAQCR